MRILMLSHSNGGGGAGRATQRLFSALSASGADVRMHVDFKLGSDKNVITNSGVLADRRRSLRIAFDEIPAVAAGHPRPDLFSPATRSAIKAERIDHMGADIVDVHWTNFGYLSIEDFGRIQSPLVWHLHDMWAFTGGENYADDGPGARWRSAYQTPPPYPMRWDIERWVYRRKARLWDRPRHLVASSSWMARLIQDSSLMCDWPVHVIPNPLDTETYAPGDQAQARLALDLPQSVPLMVALMPTNLEDPRKGFDLLQKAVTFVQQQVPTVQLAVVGHTRAPANWQRSPVKTHWLGRQDDAGCVWAYRSANVVVVPSRQDNSPQVATEALSCGTPVVAFANSGLPDFITHERTGFLARPNDAHDLARGISWILQDPQRAAAMGSFARENAASHWSSSMIAQQHLNLYRAILASTPSRQAP